MDLISQITSPELQSRLFFLKIIFLGISFGFVLAIIYFIRHSPWLELLYPKHVLQTFPLRHFEKRKTVKAWEKIKQRLESKNPSEYKIAVIEADGMLDKILERMGYAGESLGERLKQLTTATLPNLDELWQAHKVRNNIVHDPDYHLSGAEAKETLAIYEKTFKHLEIF